MSMLTYGLIAAGGALGSLARFALIGSVQRWTGSSLPWGTLVVNVFGCLAIGILSQLFAATNVREEYRLGLTAGLLGGFTTFSAFSLETVQLVSIRQGTLAAGYVMLSCGLGFVAVWIGQRIVSAWNVA